MTFYYNLNFSYLESLDLDSFAKIILHTYVRPAVAPSEDKNNIINNKKTTSTTTTLMAL